MQLALFDLNVNWTVSRTTPTVAGDLLIVRVYDPSVVIAVKRTSGELVRKTTLDNHPAAIITMSGTYYNRLVLQLESLFFYHFFSL